MTPCPHCGAPPSPRAVEYAGVRVEDHRVSVNGGPWRHVTPQRRELLELLVRAQGRAVTRDYLAIAIGGRRDHAGEPLSDNHISALVHHLRRDVPELAGRIKSEHSIGYRLAP